MSGGARATEADRGGGVGADPGVDPAPAGRAFTARRVLLGLAVVGALAVTVRSAAAASGGGYVGGIVVLVLLAIGVGRTTWRRAGRRVVSVVVVAASLVAATAAIATPIALDRRADQRIAPVGDGQRTSLGTMPHTLDPQERVVDPTTDGWRFSAVGDGPVAQASSTDHLLIAYDAEGTERWRFQLAPRPTIPNDGSDNYSFLPRVVGADGTVVVAGCQLEPDLTTSDRCLMIAVRDGVERWRNDLVPNLNWAAYAGYALGPLPDRAVATDGSVLRRFDLTTGRSEDLEVGIDGSPFLIADDDVVVLAYDACRLVGVRPTVRTLATCVDAPGGARRLVFDAHHALDVNGGDLTDLETGTATPLPALASGQQQVLAGDLIYRTAPRTMYGRGGAPTGGVYEDDDPTRWVEVLDLTGRRLRRFEGNEVGLAIGTVTTVRAVHLRSPFRDETRRVVDVYDPASGRRCARRTIDQYAEVVALRGCRALESPGGGYLLGAASTP